jgi:hypothetical protein
MSLSPVGRGVGVRVRRSDGLQLAVAIIGSNIFASPNLHPPLLLQARGTFSRGEKEKQERKNG